MFNHLRKENALLGNIGQWLGVLLMTTGFYVLVQTNTEKVKLILTAGCLIFTMATKVKHLRRK